MSLSKTQNILFLESRCYVKATRRLPQASSQSCLHRFIIIFIDGAICMNALINIISSAISISLLGFFNQFQIVAVNITVLFRHSDLIPVTLNTLCKYIIQPQFIIIFKYCKAAISGLTFFLSNPCYFAATVTTVSFFFDISQ